MVIFIAQGLAGFAVSYLICSVSECLFHNWVYHSDRRARRVFARLGPLGAPLTRAWFYHHVVHHHLTFRRDHVTQFENSAEQARLDARLRQRGRGYVIEMSYGARIGTDLVDVLYYVAPALPFLIVACVIGGGAFTLGALVPLILWPSLAQCVHPYLHMPRETALAEASGPMRAFLRSRYFRALAAHHWLHHRYEDCNFNLLLGGDMLCGVQRWPSAEDRAEMRRIGLAPSA